MKKWLMIVMQGLLTLCLYALGVVLIGLALVPSVLIVLSTVNQFSMMETMLWQAVSLSMALVIGYFCFGFSLMLVIAITRFIFNLKLIEGTHRLGSLESIKWFVSNALFLSVRIFFIDFILLTPFAVIFFKMMGAKVGHGTQINSKNIADLSLLDIGDDVVIGGNATVIAHIFEAKGLILKPVIIGNKAVIGLNAVLMPGVVVGEGAIVAAGAVVPKNTIIAPHTVYFQSVKM